MTSTVMVRLFDSLTVDTNEYRKFPYCSRILFKSMQGCKIFKCTAYVYLHDMYFYILFEKV